MHAVDGIEGGQGHGDGGQDPGAPGLGAFQGQGQQEPLLQVPGNSRDVHSSREK